MEPGGSLPYSHVPAICPILSHIDPIRVHPLPSHFLKISLNIILPSKPGSSTWSLSLMFPHQNPVCTSPLPIRATCPAHLILVDLITRIIFGEVDISVSSSLYTVHHTRYSTQVDGKIIFTNVTACGLCNCIPYKFHWMEPSVCGTRKIWSICWQRILETVTFRTK